MKRMDEQIEKLIEANKAIYDCYLQWLNKQMPRKNYEAISSDLFCKKRRVLADISLLIDEVNSRGNKRIFNLL